MRCEAKCRCLEDVHDSVHSLLPVLSAGPAQPCVADSPFSGKTDWVLAFSFVFFFNETEKQQKGLGWCFSRPAPSQPDSGQSVKYDGLAALCQGPYLPAPSQPDSQVNLGVVA